MNPQLFVTDAMNSSKNRVTKSYVDVAYVENAKVEVKDPKCPPKLWFSSKCHFPAELKPSWEHIDVRHETENLPISFHTIVMAGSLVSGRIFPQHLELAA